MCILFSFFIFIIWVLFLFFILYLYCYKRLLFPLDKSLISYLQSLFIIFVNSIRRYDPNKRLVIIQRILCAGLLLTSRCIEQDAIGRFEWLASGRLLEASNDWLSTVIWRLDRFLVNACINQSIPFHRLLILISRMLRLVSRKRFYNLKRISRMVLCWTRFHYVFVSNLNWPSVDIVNEWLHDG